MPFFQLLEWHYPLICFFRCLIKEVLIKLIMTISVLMTLTYVKVIILSNKKF